MGYSQKDRRMDGQKGRHAGTQAGQSRHAGPYFTDNLPMYFTINAVLISILFTYPGLAFPPPSQTQTGLTERVRTRLPTHPPCNDTGNPCTHARTHGRMHANQKGRADWLWLRTLVCVRLRHRRRASAGRKPPSSPAAPVRACMCTHMCVRACMRACVRACKRANASMPSRPSTGVCAWMDAYPRACKQACVCVRVSTCHRRSPGRWGICGSQQPASNNRPATATTSQQPATSSNKQRQAISNKQQAATSNQQQAATSSNQSASQPASQPTNVALHHGLPASVKSLP